MPDFDEAAIDRAAGIVAAIAQIESLQGGIVIFDPDTLKGGDWLRLGQHCDDRDEVEHVVVPVPEHYGDEDLDHLRDQARLAVRHAIERHELEVAFLDAYRPKLRVAVD